MIEQRLVALLSADETISSAIGSRIAPVVLRQEVGLPCLIYRRMNTDPSYVLSGRAGWRLVSDQIACWATTYAQARSLAEAVRKRLDAYSEPSSVGSIRFISVSDIPDDYQPDLEAFGCIVLVNTEYDDEAATL